MSDLRYCSRAFIADFIEAYKSYPCLWKIKSAEYKDRSKKNAAYTVLIKKIQEMQPDATKQTVKAKINNLRGGFRREMKKVEDSKRSGAELYEPTLWYFDLLVFTKDQELPLESVRNVVKKWESGSESEQEIDEEIKEVEVDIDDHYMESLMSPSSKRSISATVDHNPFIRHSPSISSSATTSKSSLKRTRKSDVDELSDELLWGTMGDERLMRNNTTSNNIDEDAFTIFGKHIAVKLRTLPKLTKLYTEKLINDLLFEAEMGNVNKNTKIVTFSQ